MALRRKPSRLKHGPHLPATAAADRSDRARRDSRATLTPRALQPNAPRRRWTRRRRSPSTHTSMSLKPVRATDLCCFCGATRKAVHQSCPESGRRAHHRSADLREPAEGCTRRSLRGGAAPRRGRQVDGDAPRRRGLHSGRLHRRPGAPGGLHALRAHQQARRAAVPCAGHGVARGLRCVPCCGRAGAASPHWKCRGGFPTLRCPRCGQLSTAVWSPRSLHTGGAPSTERHDPRFDSITKLMASIFNMCACTIARCSVPASRCRHRTAMLSGGQNALHLPAALHTASIDPQ